jgi:hypothetical protein
MAKKSRSRSTKSGSSDLGTNTTIVFIVAIAFVGYYVITNPNWTALIIVLGLVVGGLAVIGYYFKGSALWAVGKLTGK